MLPAFQLLPRLPNPARPAAEYDARAFGHMLTVRRKPLTKPQLQNFSRTQEVHPLWVREIGFWDDSDVGRVNLAGSEDSWREREI